MKLCKEDGCQSAKAPGRSKCYSHYGKSRRATETSKQYPSGFKLLFIDLETSPTVAYTWGLFNQNIGINQILIPGRMLCFASKWYGQDQPLEFYSEWQHGQEGMVVEAWRLLNECDAVCHYYGTQFDVKHLNAEFRQAGLLPPSPFKQIDLKLAVSSRFRFPSNKLQFVSEVFGLEGKEEHEGFPLWGKVLNLFHKYSDEVQADAQARMQSYNERDVTLLEEVYEVLLPWIPNHPSRWLYDGVGGCPTCGVDSLVEAGYAYTKLSKFRQVRCRSCGGFFRSGKRERGVALQESVL